MKQNARIIAHTLLELTNAQEDIGTQTDNVELKNIHCQTEDMDGQQYMLNSFCLLRRVPQNKAHLRTRTTSKMRMTSKLGLP